MSASLCAAGCPPWPDERGNGVQQVLAAALEALSHPVTVWEAVRDADGVAVDVRLRYRNAAASPHPGPSVAACLHALSTGIAQVGPFRIVPLGDDLLLCEGREGGLDLRRAALLADITSELARADTREDVIGILMTHGVVAVGAEGGGIVLPDATGERYVLVSSHNVHAVAERLKVIDLGAPYPMSHTVRTGQALFFRDAAERAAAFPEGERFFTDRYASTAVLPLRVDDRLRGGVSFHFAERHTFDAGERDFLTALVGQCAQALERTRARAEAERARAQLQVLADLSGRLAGVTEPDAVWTALLHAVVPTVADGAVIQVLGVDSWPGTVAHTHVGEVEAAALRTVLDHFPPSLDASTGLGPVLRTGQPEVVTDVPAALDRLARSPGHRDALAGMQATSWLITPMNDGDRRVGAMALIRGTDEPFTARDVPFAAEWGRRAAVALTRVRDLQRHRQVSADLQRGLLPRRLPDVPGMTLGSAYRPGQRDLQVGGDFYDVFPIGPRRVAVAVGDVCGTGPVAASRTALVRHSMRAFARLLSEPAAVTRAVNEALLQENLDGAFCSMAYAVLERRGDTVVADLTLAGHPLPLLRRSDGRVEALGTSGTVLGVVADPGYRATRHELHPGDALVFYTDGATERREGDRFLGEEGLGALLRHAPPGDAATLAADLERRILDFGALPLADDLAIVTVRLDEGPMQPV